MHIVRLHLEGIGVFSSPTTIPFAEPYRGSQALVLTGAGKTTALRALALALVPWGVANVHSVFGESMVSTGQSRGTARVDFSDDRPESTRDDQVESSVFLVRSRRDDIVVASSAHSTIRRDDLFVVAYGACRGSYALGVNCLGCGHGSRFVDQHRWADVSDLFDASGSERVGVSILLRTLRDMSLVSPDDCAPTERRGCAMRALAYGPVKAALAASIGVGDVSASPERNGALVDGVTITMVGSSVRGALAWVADMVARWVSREWEAGRAVADGFAASMEGVAIVDAVDEGLGPAEARVLIDRLRAVFPRMTFVFSATNPCALGAMRRGEVVNIAPDPSGRLVATAAVSSLRVLTLYEIMRVAFGITEIFAHDDGKVLSRCHTLASNPYRTDDEEAEMRLGISLLSKQGVALCFEPETRVQL